MKSLFKSTLFKIFLFNSRSRNKYKVKFLLSLFALCFGCSFFISSRIFSNSGLSSSSDDETLFENKNLKYIQLYTGVFDYKDWGQPGLGTVPFKNCPEKRCYAFKPFIRQKALEQSDGVLVHGPNLWYLPDKKTYKRNSRQLWMYYALESPRGSMCSSHYKPTDLDDWFNITATYKSDSDYIVNYSPFNNWQDVLDDAIFLNEFKKYYLSKNEKLLLDPDENIIKNELLIKNKIIKEKKQAPVVWFVSHCETSSRREFYVNEMRKYIDIDIYGKCGSYFSNSLPDPCASSNEEPQKCFNRILNSYKFYLSFENSLCDDYITEKYWKLYKANTIFNVNLLPITRGATESQFKRVSPPNSYINAYNFDSAKALADHLNYLNGNDTAYLEYFNWKIDFYKNLENQVKNSKKILEQNIGYIDKSTFLMTVERSPFCIMCSKLHNETYMENKNNKNKIWKLSEWFGTKTSNFILKNKNSKKKKKTISTKNF
jgi:alpha-1,3-fucosyltransferase